MADRENDSLGFLTPPSLREGVRDQMLNSLYDKFYSNALPRQEYDRQMAGKSDFDLANVAYDTFYKGKMSRPDFNKQVGLTTAGGSTTNALVRGASLNFSDEVGAAIKGASSALRGEGFRTGYDQAMQAQRENHDIFTQNNPYIGRGVEMLGGLGIGAKAVGAGASAPPVSLPRMAGQGAILGGIAGAGDAEGGLGERAIGAGIGATVGAAAPPVIYGAAYGGGVFGRAIANLLGLTKPENAATRQISRAMSDASLTADDVSRAVSQFPADKPVTLADVTGMPGRNLAATVANRPGRAMEMADNLVEARRFDAPDRIASDIDRMVAPGSGRGVADAFEALSSKRTRETAPLADLAFSRPFGMTGRVREMIDDPIAQAGLAKGLEIQRLENLALRPSQRRSIEDAAIQFADDGTPKIVGTPNMRTLDAVKRGLDNILEGYRGPDGRLQLDQRGRAIESLRKAYVGELDLNNPLYAEYRAAWAGPSSAMDAVNLGRRIVTGDRDTVARAFENLADGNKDFYRLGVARALTDRTTDPSQALNFVRRMVEDRTLNTKLRGLFENRKDFDEFVSAMKAELQMRVTNRAISPRSGSQTARLIQGSEDVTGNVGGLAADLLQLGANGGRPTWGILNRIHGRSQVGTPAMSEAVAKRLFSTDRAGIAQALQEIQTQQVVDAITAQQRHQIVRALLGGASAATPEQFH